MSKEPMARPLCRRCGVAPAAWLGDCRACARLRIASISAELRAPRRPSVASDVERDVLRVVQDEIGRVLDEYAEGGRDSKVIRKVHAGLRLALRQHFAGEGEP